MSYVFSYLTNTSQNYDSQSDYFNLEQELFGIVKSAEIVHSGVQIDSLIFYEVNHLRCDQKRIYFILFLSQAPPSLVLPKSLLRLIELLSQERNLFFCPSGKLNKILVPNLTIYFSRFITEINNKSNQLHDPSVDIWQDTAAWSTLGLRLSS